MAVELHRALAATLETASILQHQGLAVAVTTPYLEPDFTVSLDRRRDRLVVVLNGMLDESTVGELRRAFVQVLNEPARLVVFDVSGVPLIDSDGFGVLINIQKRLTESDRTLALAGCQEAVRLALSLTRLEVLFPSFATVESVPAP